MAANGRRYVQCGVEGTLASGFVYLSSFQIFSFTNMPALHVPAVMHCNGGSAVRGGDPTLFPPATVWT